MKAEPLVDKVSQYFPNRSKTCIYNLLVLSLAILLKEAVCLNRLKGSLGAITGKPSIKAGSHYKRLIRIFDDYAFSSLWRELVRYVFTLLQLKSKYILLDGTSWQAGFVWHQFFLLLIFYSLISGFSSSNSCGAIIIFSSKSFIFKLSGILTMNTLISFCSLSSI